MIDKNRLKEYDNVVIHESKGGQYAVKIKENGKTKACAYIKLGQHNRIYRVFVDEADRGKGYGKMVMNAIIQNFGDWNLSLNACPNRISDLTAENVEYYKAKLFKFYESFGFVKNNKNNTMYRKSNNTTVNTLEDIFE